MPAARHGGFPRVAHGSGNVLAVLGIQLSRYAAAVLTGAVKQNPEGCSERFLYRRRPAVAAHGGAIRTVPA